MKPSLSISSVVCAPENHIWESVASSLTFENDSSGQCSGNKWEAGLQNTEPEKAMTVAAKGCSVHSLLSPPRTKCRTSASWLRAGLWTCKVAQTQAQILTCCPCFLAFLLWKSHFLLFSWLEPGEATQMPGKTGSEPGQEVIWMALGDWGGASEW